MDIVDAQLVDHFVDCNVLWFIVCCRPVTGIQWVALFMLAAAGACNG